MKKKTARRWLNRNRWRLIANHVNPSDLKYFKKCIKSLND